MTGLLQLAIPVFLAAAVVEWLISRRRGWVVHRLADSITDLGCGMLSQLTELFLVVLSVGGYRFVQEQWTLQLLTGAPPWPTGPGGWVLAFLLADVGQYVVHRISHRMSFLWACHVVHHSSEELNYTVAMRNTSLHGLFIWVFTLPLAFIGLPWQMFAASYGLNVLYQFWLHTRLVGRLGPLEWVLNTPSHHRVHHGRDREYVDRNFGGVLIIWDRLFGTFAEERQEPEYGVQPRFRSSNPVWANLDGWVEIGRAWRRAGDWRGRARAVFGPPDWKTGPDPERDSKFAIAPAALGYALAQLGVAIVLTLLVLRHAPQLSWAERFVALVVIAATVGSVGGLLDGRAWVPRIERLRLGALGLGGLAALRLERTTPTSVLVAVTAYVLLSAGWFWLVRRESPSPARQSSGQLTAQVSGSRGMSAASPPPR